MKTFVKTSLLFAALALARAGFAAPVQLVTDETIKIQKDLTKIIKLKNGIPVIYRNIPDSDILQLEVGFGTGLKDLKPGRKVLNEWMWSALPLGGKDYPKAKVFELMEKYGIELQCSGGIEVAACSVGTLNDYWEQSLALLAGVVNAPAFTEEDAKLTKDRLTASLKNQASDPGQYINEIVNSIFYPPGHPYRLNHDEALAELEKLSRQDLVDYHKAVLNASVMSLVVVTSMPADKVVADLEKAFGSVPSGNFEKITPQPPKFELSNSYAFNARDLPTAYIRIKLNAPSITDKDAVATRVLYEILSEELGEEIRTKRSLSYAVHSFVIQYSLGIGVLSASTSKPKETLEAMDAVLRQIKSKLYSEEEIEEYKHVFATGYYLTQETHASLAQALTQAYYFYGDPNEHYELPRRLDKVTPADIKRLANELLDDPRVGVIYGRSEFKDEWAKDFIKKNLSAAAGAKKS